MADHPNRRFAERNIMIFYGKTDVGQRRAENQDNFVIKKYADDVLFAVVCDGMGGAKGGSTASAIAVETFEEVLENKSIAVYSICLRVIWSATRCC